LKDIDNEKKHLLEEIAKLHQRILELEKLEVKHKEIEQAFQEKEKILRKSSDRFRSLVETTSDWIWEVDKSAVYTYVSPKIYDILGYESREVIGKTPFELMPADEAVRVGDIFKSFVDEKKPFNEIENINIHKDGRFVILETSGVPIFNKDGELKGYRGIDRDITLRKKAEEKLALSESKLRNIIHNTPGMIYRGYPDWSTELIKGCEDISGYSKDEINSKEKNWISIIHQDDRERVINEALKLEQNSDSLVSIYRIINKKNKVVWVEDRKSAEFNEEGMFAGVYGIVFDISKRIEVESQNKQLISELNHKTSDLEQLLYVISHDLRSPLVNIDGYSKELDYSLMNIMSLIDNANFPSSLKEEINLIAKEVVPESLHYIQISVKKMESLLKGILTLSRLGRSNLTIEERDMNDMMNDILDTHKYRLNQIISKTEVSKLPNCKGDSLQINQVFSNLLDNAIKYVDSERSSVINISGYRDKNQSVYCIKDNGLGIAPEYQDKIFEIFHQLEPDRFKGEGMGLTIVNKIIERHKGKIWVESELGKGCKFFVSLPKA